MKIIVDAMGGDHAPAEIVRGALLAAKEFELDICLVGRGDLILEVIRDEGHADLPPHIEISHAQEVVGMEDDPASVLREKPDSSLVKGLRMLSEGGGDAFVSAGSTGALLSCSTLLVKRIRGIRRAALAPIVPNALGKTLLIDSGANVECTAEYLLQFAFLGKYYAGKVMGMQEPRVGLLNIGTEETKGDSLHREAYRLLKEADEQGRIRFVGNVEGRAVMDGVCDVLVADGFSGNIFLKTMEGMGLLFAGLIKGIFMKNLGTKLAALFVRDGIGGIRKLLDYNEVGGAPLLGIAKPVIKAHGSAKAYTVRSAILQAKKYVDGNISQEISDNIDFMKSPTDFPKGS